jgi:hypothetical protein
VQRQQTIRIHASTKLLEFGIVKEKCKKHNYDDQKGAGGASVVGGVSAGSGRGNPNVTANTVAVQRAEKNKTSVADEQIKIDKLLQAKREIEAAKAKPERQEAVSKAQTRQEGNVKITE